MAICPSEQKRISERRKRENEVNGLVVGNGEQDIKVELVEKGNI